VKYGHCPEGFIETGWIDLGKPDISKSWSAIRLFGEFNSGLYANVYYMADAQSTWTALSGDFDTTPYEEITFTAIAAKRIKLGLRLTRAMGFSSRTSDRTYYSPFIRALVSKVYIPEDVKYTYAINFKAEDNPMDLEGDDDVTYTDMNTLIQQLITWAKAGTVLTMQSTASSLDSKTVVIDPPSLTPTKVLPDEPYERALGYVTLNEV
jgi:hypothetical protein